VRILIFGVGILGSVLLIQLVSRSLGITRVPIGHALTMLLMASTALAVYLTLVQRLEQRPATELAPTRALPELLAGILLGGVLISVVILVLWLPGLARLSWSGQVAGALIGGTAVALGSGVVEELLMRGVVFRIIAQWLGSGVALVISAVLCGGLHAFNPGATAVSCVAIAIEAGILLAAAYLYTRRLWLPIGVHVGWNYFEGSFYGASVSGGTLPSLFASHFSGNVLLSGGKFGPEASIIAVVVCGITGVWMLLRAFRRR
jgi:uncharacterized protein